MARLFPFPAELRGLRVIWSHEHGAWWRPNSKGYTTELMGAGLYTHAEAEKICEWKFAGRAPEVHHDAETKWERYMADVSPDCFLSRIVLAPERSTELRG